MATISALWIGRSIIDTTQAALAIPRAIRRTGERLADFGRDTLQQGRRGSGSRSCASSPNTSRTVRSGSASIDQALYISGTFAFMSFVSRLRLRTKAMIAPALFALVAAFMTYSAVQQYRTSLLLERTNQVKAVMQGVLAILATLADAEERGDLSREVAQTRASDYLAHIHFNGDDYVIAIDRDGVYQSHPNPAWAHVPHQSLPSLPRTMSEHTLHDLQISAEAIYLVKVPRAAGGKRRLKLNYAVTFAPWQWAIGTGLYIDDVNSAVRHYAYHLGAVSLAATALTCLAAWLVMLEFDRGLRRVLDAMAQMQMGCLEQPVLGGQRRDEAGRLARALERFRISLRDARQLRARHAEMTESTVAEQRRIMTQTADVFEGKVRIVASTVCDAAGHLEATARRLQTATDAAIGNAKEASLVADAASENVHSAAHGVEQMSSSIAGVTSRVADAATTTQDAVLQVECSGRIVRNLAQTAGQIGEIVGLIQTIAGQTNLLALNATIEAARAGQSGQAFAVVAGEVKALAVQTARATQRVQGQIQAVQADTRAAVAAFTDIERSIEQLSGVAGQIDDAMDQQNGSARQIALDVQRVSA